MRRAAIAPTALTALILVTLAVPWLASVAGAGGFTRATVQMPWKQAGLTERQAAAHLLNRFTFGPRPGQVDAAVAMGLDRFLERQLAGDLADAPMAARLRPYPALAMTTAEILRLYPPPGVVLAEARRDGAISDKNVQGIAAGTIDAAGAGAGGEGEKGDKKEVRAAVLRYAREKGYRPEKELLGQVMTQKLLRAVYSENQLSEVMTDFWFNHFNVSTTNNRLRPYLLSYERDAIRPFALGRFRDLLGATARHPAMLLYLDNAQSSAPADAETTMGDEMRGRRPARLGGGFGGPGGRRPGFAAPRAANPPAKKQERGLNENFARELMELHTLGVDGGYTQKDVVEVARAFTGWTVVPLGPGREKALERLERARRAGGLGFEVAGDFLFRADTHDAGPKTILGHRFPAGRGIQDGEEVLDLLAAQPATARHLASQLAVRFVSDQPSKALVDHLASVFTQSGGDTRATLRAIVESPEFWSREARGAKIKSPFELAASALRAVGGEVEDPRATLEWISRIGQPLYAYQAPTGYPDRAEAWVNTGSLLSRMNFGLQLAAGRVPGVRLDLAALNGGFEPESRERALQTYASLLMPERDLAQTLKLLQPMVANPELAKKVDEAAPSAPAAPAAPSDRAAAPGDDEMAMGEAPAVRPARAAKNGGAWAGAGRRPPTAVEQVVGVILGSPEFQRR